MKMLFQTVNSTVTYVLSCALEIAKFVEHWQITGACN